MMDELFGYICNCKIKQFPNSQSCVVCSRPIWRPKAADSDLSMPLVDPESIPECPSDKDPDSEPLARNIRRAYTRVHDIAALNDFAYFCTWTLDKDKINRYDPKIISEKLKTHLKHQVERHNLIYLLVPEHHKDGAIHMHGLINGDDLRLKDSGKRVLDKLTGQRKPVYNLLDWKYGFSTCIKVTGDPENVAKYITKYVSKDFKKIFGNFYYAGGDIMRDAPVSFVNLPYELIDCKEYHCAAIDAGFKYFSMKDGDLTHVLRGGI